MNHDRILNLGRERVVVTCACEAWSVTLPARSGVGKAAAEAHDEHLATISPDALPPEQQGEQGRGVASVASLPDHQDKGTPAVHAEVPVMSPRTGSEAR